MTIGGGPAGAGWACFELDPAARAVAGARMDAEFLAGVADDLDGDLAEAVVGIRLRVISDRVRVTEILSNIFESLDLFLPRLGVIGLAAGALRDAAEYGGGYGVAVDLGGRDHVDGDSLVFFTVSSDNSRLNQPGSTSRSDLMVCGIYWLTVSYDLVDSTLLKSRMPQNFGSHLLPLGIRSVFGVSGAFVADRLDRTVIIAPRFASNSGANRAEEGAACEDKLAPAEASVGVRIRTADSWRFGGPENGTRKLTSYDFMGPQRSTSGRKRMSFGPSADARDARQADSGRSTRSTSSGSGGHL